MDQITVECGECRYIHIEEYQLKKPILTIIKAIPGVVKASNPPQMEIRIDAVNNNKNLFLITWQ